MASEELWEQNCTRCKIGFFRVADRGNSHRILRVRALVLPVINQQGPPTVCPQVDELASGMLDQKKICRRTS